MAHKKNKKVGSDCLSKKDRRALKVSQKSGSPITSDNTKKVSNVSSKEACDISKPAVEQNKWGSRNIEKEPKNVVRNKGTCGLPEKRQDSKQEKVESKEIGDNVENSVPSATPTKAQLRAERRALQERQRLVKTSEKVEVVKKEVKEPQKAVIKPQAKKPDPKTDTENEHRVHLFNHLYFNSSLVDDTETKTNGLHSSFIRLGVQYRSKTVLGSNARCLALLCALKEFIIDFSTPVNQELCRSVELYVQKNVLYLQKCRCFAVSMTNALKHFKLCLTQIDTNLSDAEKKEKILDVIETYKQEQIAKAGEAISIKVNEKITNKDIILTYGCSSLVRQILSDAHRQGKHFKVIIVDSRPLLEGREMLRTLIGQGIDCTYGLINSVSFFMSKATKVLLGAHALLANGYVMSRVGTAQVALIAQNYNKPVLVCCETYKFCERVQTDCVVYNEIGDTDKLINIDTSDKESPLANWRQSKCLKPLNLLYDITPPDFVTAVVTELGFLPCTSVPVVLRIKPTE